MPSDIPLGLADQPLSAKIYEALRERIIEGALRPGERIRERELAEELNVSRIPIREAMPRLEAEGFIRTLPRRGAVVTEMTIGDVEELFVVRSSLEVLAAMEVRGREVVGLVARGRAREPTGWPAASRKRASASPWSVSS